MSRDAAVVDAQGCGSRMASWKMEKGFRRPSGHVAALLCLRGCAPWAAEVGRAARGRESSHVMVKSNAFGSLPGSHT